MAIYYGSTPPEDTTTYQKWVDTSTVPYGVYAFDGTNWCFKGLAETQVYEPDEVPDPAPIGCLRFDTMLERHVGDGNWVPAGVCSGGTPEP